MTAHRNALADVKDQSQRIWIPDGGKGISDMHDMMDRPIEPSYSSFLTGCARRDSLHVPFRIITKR